MRLEQLTVRNLGIFRGARSFDLNADKVVIYGTNSSGKTTLAQAIYFVLSGKVLTNGLRPSALVSENEAGGTSGLTYHHAGQRYRIWRSAKGDFKAEKFLDKEWMGLKDHPVLPTLNSIQWQIGCFLKEEDVSELITQTPKNRAEILNHILGIGQLLDAREALVKVRRLGKRNEKTALARQSALQYKSFQDVSADLNKFKSEVAALDVKFRAQNSTDPGMQLRREWKQGVAVIRARLMAPEAEQATLLSGFRSLEDLETTIQKAKGKLGERDRYARELETSSEKRIALEADARRIAESLARIRDLDTHRVCPTCHQSLPQDLIDGLEREYQQAHETTTGALAKAEAAEKEAREFMTLVQELDRREADLSQRLARLRVLQAEIRELEKNLEGLENKLSALDRESGGGREESLENKLEQSRARLQEIETRQTLFLNHIRETEEANSQVEKASKQRLLAEWLTDAVEGTLKSVVGISMEQADHDVMECLAEFKLFSGCEPIRLGDSQLMPDVLGRDFRTLSGSEKAIIYLGTKMAVSRLMPGCDFIVLDNPTVHLDPARRQLMADFLSRRSPAKQLIILTNDKIFADQITDGKRINL